MNSQADNSKPATFKKFGTPFPFIIKGVLGVLAILVIFPFIAAVAFFVKEGGKEEKPALTQGDFATLLSTVHIAWTKIPANRVASSELKAFDQLRSDLEVALESIDWSRGLKKREADKLQALAKLMHDSSTKLATQLSTQDSDLLKAMTSVQTETRELMTRAEQKHITYWFQKVLVAYSEAIKALAKMGADWPFVTIAGLVLLFAYADRLGGISNVFSGVQSIKVAGGNEIIFSPSQAIERSKAANDVFKSYREKATIEFASMANGEKIATRLKNVCEGPIKKRLRENAEAYLKDKKRIKESGTLTEEDDKKLEVEVMTRWNSLRFTVFVKDLLFENTLCQLVDYYPPPEKPTTTAGRAWDIRYGMIGRVWRMQRSHSEMSVTTEEDKLVTEWGMTRDEIKNFVSKKKTFTTVVFENHEVPFALFYMDSNLEDAFALEKRTGATDKMDELHQCVVNACKEYKLTDALGNVARQIENKKLDIRIHG